jgi:PAS domain S-box-containing protein
VLQEQSRQHTRQLLEAQVALEESHDRYVSLYDFAPVAFVSLDQSGIIRDLNLAAAELLGSARGQLVGAPMVTFVAPESKRGFLNHMFKCRRGNVPAATEFTLQPRAPHGQRPHVPVQMSTWFGVPRGGAGWEFRTALLDLTDRKAAEEREHAYLQRLRSLATELSLAEERERRRIAVEIHDNISQSLAVAKMKLQGVAGRAGPPEVARAIAEVSDVVSDVLVQTRSLTFELSPPVLHELGFQPALEWLAERAEKQHRLSVSVDLPPEAPEVPHDVAVLLFQATRELLVNVAKHAHARRVVLRLRTHSRRLELSVEDDGTGFLRGNGKGKAQPPADLQAADDGQGGGFGLFSIRARLEHLGGALSMHARPGGGGARVTLSVPLFAHPATGGAGPADGNAHDTSTSKAFGGGRVGVDGSAPSAHDDGSGRLPTSSPEGPDHESAAGRRPPHRSRRTPKSPGGTA